MGRGEGLFAASFSSFSHAEQSKQLDSKMLPLAVKAKQR